MAGITGTLLFSPSRSCVVVNSVYFGSMTGRILLVISMLCWSLHAFTQQLPKVLYPTDTSRDYIDIPFRLVHNLILIPVWVNDSDTLFMILDSGVRTTLLTDLGGIDSLSLKRYKPISLYGLGKEQPTDAWLTWDNTIRLPGASGQHFDIIVVADQQLDFTARLGMPVHGILGYDFFRSFDVAIDYSKQKLTLYPPGQAPVSRSMAAIQLTLYRQKPYLTMGIAAPGHYDSTEALYQTMLLDIGASHGLALYPKSDAPWQVPINSIPTYLGQGLSGPIEGAAARIEAVSIGPYCLCSPIAVYPDRASLQYQTDTTLQVAGSIGGDLLQRFDLMISYKRTRLYLQKNRERQKPFRYNTSGLDIIKPIENIPVYTVAHILKDSPAARAGIQVGDQLTHINGLSVTTLSLNEVLHLLNGRPGRKMRIHVHRNGTSMRFSFRLKDAL